MYPFCKQHEFADTKESVLYLFGSCLFLVFCFILCLTCTALDRKEYFLNDVKVKEHEFLSMIIV